MSIIEETHQLSNNWVDLLTPRIDTCGRMNYEDFSALALFHPDQGYYSKKHLKRVGKTQETDFYTSSTHHLVFPELVANASLNLWNKFGLTPAPTTFCELGGEPYQQGQWNQTELNNHPIEIKSIQLGETFNIPNNSIVHSNELFDAQPFFRWVAINGEWKPIHLQLKGNNLSECIGEDALTETELESKKWLPPAPAFEYHLDLSIQAIELLKTIVSDEWKGVFIAFDYGKSWKTLIEEIPQGTARAYTKHKQTNTLFHNPGEQDLTTHVCWDHLSSILHSNGFSALQFRSQSRFLMEEAQQRIEAIVKSSETLLDKRKGQLMELISPGYFGEKFEVLSAVRQ